MAWNDPEIGIEWPQLKGEYKGSASAEGYTLEDGTALNLSDKDQKWLGLKDNLWLNPLSDVMGGWGIWETVNGEQKLTTECIENIIMMVPFSSVAMWTFGEKIGNGWKKIPWQSGKIVFIFSVSIKLLELHHLGYDLRHYHTQHHAFIKQLNLPEYYRFDAAG